MVALQGKNIIIDKDEAYVAFAVFIPIAIVAAVWALVLSTFSLRYLIQLYQTLRKTYNNARTTLANVFKNEVSVFHFFNIFCNLVLVVVVLLLCIVLGICMKNIKATDERSEWNWIPPTLLLILFENTWLLGNFSRHMRLFYILAKIFVRVKVNRGSGKGGNTGKTNQILFMVEMVLLSVGVLACLIVLITMGVLAGQKASGLLVVVLVLEQTFFALLCLVAAVLYFVLGIWTYRQLMPTAANASSLRNSMKISRKVLLLCLTHSLMFVVEALVILLPIVLLNWKWESPIWLLSLQIWCIVAYACVIGLPISTVITANMLKNNSRVGTSRNHEDPASDDEELGTSSPSKMVDSGSESYYLPSSPASPRL